MHRRPVKVIRVFDRDYAALVWCDLLDAAAPLQTTVLRGDHAVVIRSPALAEEIALVAGHRDAPDEPVEVTLSVEGARVGAVAVAAGRIGIAVERGSEGALLVRGTDGVSISVRAS